MFLFFFLFEDLKENSFIQLAIPIMGYLAIIYLVLRSGSFTSENQKYLHLAVYLTGLWFTLARNSNYILGLVNYQLEHPLTIFFIGYLGLTFTLIFKSKTLNIEESFKSLTTYGELEAERLIQNLENLILLYKGSENGTKERIILLGYVSAYQNLYDSNTDSYISFQRLSSHQSYITPESYYQNLREGFERHLSSIYLEALQRYPKCIKLRLSYAYYLNDIMKLKNHAISVSYSCQLLDKTFMEGYHFNYQKNKLESFENGGELEYLPGRQSISDMKAKDNIFLRISQEDQIVKKSITAIKRRQYRILVKQSIVQYSDL